MQAQLDFLAANNAKEMGMLRVEESVNRIYEGWSLEALNFLKIFLDEIGFREFQAEDFKVWAEDKGLRVPINRQGKTAWRVLGPLFIKAKKEGLIMWIRIEPTKGASAHCANASVYRRS